MFNNPVAALRKAAQVEGLSFLVLLGVAMPLKYALDLPLAVKIVGWIHGILFMWLCLLLVFVLRKANWPFVRALQVFIAALLPFGPFVLDKRMVEYEKEFEQRHPESLLAK